MHVESFLRLVSVMTPVVLAEMFGKRSTKDEEMHASRASLSTTMTNADLMQ